MYDDEGSFEEAPSTPFLNGMGEGKNQSGMGDGAKSSAQDRATNMALSAVKKYGPPQARIAANVLAKNPKMLKRLKWLRYLRIFGCLGAGCLPVLLMILAASAIIALAWILLMESGWFGDALAWFSDELSEIKTAMEQSTASTPSVNE